MGLATTGAAIIMVPATTMVGLTGATGVEFAAVIGVAAIGERHSSCRLKLQGLPYKRQLLDRGVGKGRATFGPPFSRGCANGDQHAGPLSTTVNLLKESPIAKHRQRWRLVTSVALRRRG